jgi:hypothetical protein
MALSLGAYQIRMALSLGANQIMGSIRLSLGANNASIIILTHFKKHLKGYLQYFNDFKLKHVIISSYTKSKQKIFFAPIFIRANFYSRQFLSLFIFWTPIYQKSDNGYLYLWALKMHPSSSSSSNLRSNLIISCLTILRQFLFLIFWTPV